MGGSKNGDGEKKVVYGRGGAGNIGSPSLQPTQDPKISGANDLETPTLKTAKYSTGRGGSGNIASNDNPELTRDAQDLKAPLAAELLREGGQHTGRGGTGNTWRPSEAEAKEAREHNEKVRSHSRGHEDYKKHNEGSNLDKFKGLAEKSKEKVLGK